MEKLRQTLSVIFYLIWIPLGLLLIAGAIFMIVARPFTGMMEGMQMMSQFGPPPGAESGGFEPSEEMMKQFIPNVGEEQGPR